MFRVAGPIFACVLMAGIVGCSGRDPVADGANNTAGLPDVDEMPSADGAPPEKVTAPANQAPATPAKIPAALQGRWGLAPLDCTSARGDAKGLLIISDRELRFYESRAVPASDIQTETDTISGNFAFTGEGQSWSKFQAIKLQGRDLVRTETNPTASFTYAKCT